MSKAYPPVAEDEDNILDLHDKIAVQSTHTRIHQNLSGASGAKRWTRYLCKKTFTVCRICKHETPILNIL
jgi:hypothetical protein